MKAAAQDRYGASDAVDVEETEPPVVKDDDVLVRVRAAGVNALDWHVMRGSPYWARLVIGPRRPRPRIRGVDVAGEVEAVGRNVQRFQPGDAVFGWCSGAFAEFASAPEDQFMPKPARLTFEQAAAVPLASTTALQGLRDIEPVRPGQKVLIVGASGGVGTFAVQIAKGFGAEVTGVCSARNLELVRSLGADHVVDYASEDVTLNGQHYDLIFELAGTRSPSAYRRVMTASGTLVMSSGAGSPWVGPMGRMLKAKLASPFVGQRMVFLAATMKHADLVTLVELIEAGTITPVMDRSFSLSDAPAAIGYLEAGHTRGKTVITV